MPEKRANANVADSPVALQAICRSAASLRLDLRRLHDLRITPDIRAEYLREFRGRVRLGLEAAFTEERDQLRFLQGFPDLGIESVYDRRRYFCRTEPCVPRDVVGVSGNACLGDRRHVCERGKTLFAAETQRF